MRYPRRVLEEDDQPLRLAELLEMNFPPRRWVVENILPAGLSLLTSPPKIGKSFIAFAISLACGYKANLPALDHFRTFCSQALYFDFENSLPETQRRAAGILTYMKSRYGQHMTEEPAVFVHNNWPRLDRGGDEKLWRWLDEHPEVRLVIIDTIAWIWPQLKAAGKNAYFAEYDFFAPIKRAAGDRDIAILLLHHDNKTAASATGSEKTDRDFVTRPSGTQALPGIVDAIWALDRRRGESEARLHVAGRSVLERTIDLRMDRHAGLVVTNDPLAGPTQGTLL